MPSMKGSISFGIDLEHQDTGITIPATVYVAYTYHPWQPGQRDDGLGPRISPDEEAHCEIDSVELGFGEDACMTPMCNGPRIKLTEYDQADIERRCMEDAES